MYLYFISDASFMLRWLGPCMPSGQHQELKTRQANPQTEVTGKGSAPQPPATAVFVPHMPAPALCHASLPAPAHPPGTGFTPPPLHLVRRAPHYPRHTLPLLPCSFPPLGPCLKPWTPFPNPHLQGMAQVPETGMTSTQSHSAQLRTLHCNLTLSSGHRRRASLVQIGTRGKVAAAMYLRAGPTAADPPSCVNKSASVSSSAKWDWE